MNEVIQAVSTVGFPIACCCFLLWQNSKQDEYHRAQQEKLRERMREADFSLSDDGAELRELEADPLVRLADEEEELRECLLQIRKILKDKQARGRRLEAMGITPELINRYRKDYADTDWGC
jgi:hypothetical protein